MGYYSYSELDKIGSQQLRIRKLEKENAELKSGETIRRLTEENERLKDGEEIQKLKEQYDKQLAGSDRKIAKLEKGIRQKDKEIAKLHRITDETIEDAVKETERELKKTQKSLVELERKNIELQEALAEEKKLVKELQQDNEELHGKILALTARLNKDYTNSSKPSSADPNHRKIYNSREKTGRMRGAQPGHEHHPRKRRAADRVMEIPAPEAFADRSKYRPTGKMIIRQLINLNIGVEAVDYKTPEYICLATGKKVHAPFPAGVEDDVNYGAGIKALAFMLNTGCNVSINRTGEFIKEVSGGAINIANGTIYHLSREFSRKTEKERAEIFNELLGKPVMHSDFTFGRVNGAQGTILVCCSDGYVLYQGRKKKGRDAVENSPAALYQGTLITDHESSLLNRGSRHQECLSHVQRYLKGSIENEPDRTWNKSMQKWVTDTIKYWHSIKDSGGELDKDTVSKFEKEYDSIIQQGKKEYSDKPPSKYYRDGYNLYKRMSEDKEDYQLFLHDLSVPPTNNAAEVYARQSKGKIHQASSFRSWDGWEYFCDNLSILQTLKSKGTENLYSEIVKRFQGSTV